MHDVTYFLSTHSTLFLLLVTLLSLFIGSFLNVLIYRLPLIIKAEFELECRYYLSLPIPKKQKKISLSLPLSFCPYCKHSIPPWHNIPLLSYIFLRGKCSTCHHSISYRYPLVELVTAVLSLLIAWHFGFTSQAFAALLFLWLLIALTFIDIEHNLLPDQLTYLLLWSGLSFSLFNIFSNTHTAIMGAICGYLIFAIIDVVFNLVTGKTGIGMGDFKLLAALGAFLGWQALPFIIFFSSLMGALIALLIMLKKRKFKSEPIPFGPYLALGGIIALLFEKNILQFYFSNF